MNVFLLIHALAPMITGKYLAEIFPDQFMKNIPYQDVQPYHCIRPGCSRHMVEEEMFPPGRLTPRAVCPRCWSELTSVRNEECLVCGDYLEDWRFEIQDNRPRDIRFRIHGLRCSDYWSIVSAKALGQDMSFLRDEAHILTKERPQIIDAECKKVRVCL